jgi:hypothetical protein
MVFGLMSWFSIPGGGLNIASVVYISLDMHKYSSVLVVYGHVLVVQ